MIKFRHFLIWEHIDGGYLYIENGQIKFFLYKDEIWE